MLKIGDSVTPTVVRALQLLKDHFVILTTSRAVKMSTTSFLWDFEKVEIKPLTKVDSLRLFHQLTNDLEELTFIGIIMVIVMFGRYFFRGAKRTKL